MKWHGRISCHIFAKPWHTTQRGQWVFIVDQLNTHKSASLVEFIAEACGLNEELGVKGKWGTLQSMETCMHFLSDPTHRIRFVYPPKHASW
ncbi:transposase [Xenorhabdus bovienii]|nr:transposase [Xenorhabdus bovienii]MDE9503726.1 transposase [Xenorhabdus bovienii]MDE9527435.1 transposase [Xenorhabdus bovienii]MDE9570572.1 transposase [Xenorhabdus bovienii]